MSEAAADYHFERMSHGSCYKVRVPEELSESGKTSMYITINDHGEFKPFEFFQHFNAAEHYELLTVIARLGSMALREGVQAEVIAKELQDIHSPVTNHMIPGTRDMAPSLSARIGMALAKHLEQQKQGERHNG